MSNFSVANWLKRPVFIAMLWASGITLLITLLLFFLLGDDRAAAFGDTFGFAGALLSGIALIGVAASLHQIDDGQEQQKEQLRSQQGQINALAAIARAITDPVIVARVELSQSILYFLVVENMGKRPAYNVRFELQPRSGLYPGVGEDLNLANLGFIKNGLPVMAPGQKVAAYIVDGVSLEKLRNEGGEYVSEFSLTVVYDVRLNDSNGNTAETRQYEYSFSFDAQRGTAQHRNDAAEELHVIKQIFEETIGGARGSRYIRVSKEG